jgi:hypothetical protein
MLITNESVQQIFEIFAMYVHLCAEKCLQKMFLKQDTAIFLVIQGGEVNRGLKYFFSIYRPSCLIEAYIRPEKYCFV